MLSPSKQSEYITVLKQQIADSYSDKFGLPRLGGVPNYSISVNFGLGDIQVDTFTALNIRRELLNFFQTQIDTDLSTNHKAQSFRNIETYNSNDASNKSGMIDWFRGEILFDHKPIPTGKVLSIESDGTLLYECSKSTFARGSHESSLKLQSSNLNTQGIATTLRIDGNISKFVQGHNVFGSLDMNKILLQAFNRIIQTFGDLFSYTGSFEQLKNIAQAEKRIEEGYYLVKMFDINFLYDLGSDSAVEQWLYSAELNARSRTGSATKSKTGNTVYINQHSSRWAIKWYNKFKEITSTDKKHRLHTAFLDKGLPEFMEGKLRSELRIMSLELKDLGLKFGSQLTPQVLTDLYNNYMEKIEMKPNKTLISEELLKLPRELSNTYHLWKSGVSVKDALPQNTFYRHRRKLIELGVDIKIPPVEADVPNNVIPMMRVIEAEPVENPEWAYQQGLIAI